MTAPAPPPLLPPIVLTPPRQDLLASYAAALLRGWSPDMGPEACRHQLLHLRLNPRRFLADLVRQDGYEILPNGRRVARLPSRLFWISDGEFCGTIRVRYRPGSEELPSYISGHIGYIVAPWKQRRGYATRALALILPDCRQVGLRRVLVTCDDDNIASRKVILANGGVYEGTEPHPRIADKVRLRFWIDLYPSA